MKNPVALGRALVALLAMAILVATPLSARADDSWREKAQRAGLFCSSNVTGVTTQAGLSATTPALTLYNPKGSGKDLVLYAVGWHHTVAPAAASTVWLAVNNDPNAAAVTGTLTSTKIFNTLIGNTSSPTGQCLLAATLPAAPTAALNLGAMLTGAITTAPSVGVNWTYFDGAFVVHPGGAVSFQTSTASGASGFWGTFIWYETETSLP
ncbi:MAG TPA: hypothetical protein VD932_03190 [Aquabacterium sp.]|nr:hypothetical protein [Aquabacterium sp.]